MRLDSSRSAILANEINCPHSASLEFFSFLQVSAFWCDFAFTTKYVESLI